MCYDQRHFKGTIALKPSTYAFLLKEICDNFIRDGYRLVLAISGHRGNDHAAISGLQEAAYDSASHVLYMCYQDANKGRLAEIIGPEAATHIQPQDLSYGADGHGGSVELSIAVAHAQWVGADGQAHEARPRAGGSPSHISVPTGVEHRGDGP